MRSKLATWSTEKEKGHKFDHLLRLVVDEVLLSEAARNTPPSRGALTRGVHAVDKCIIESHLFQYK